VQERSLFLLHAVLSGGQAQLSAVPSLLLSSLSINLLLGSWIGTNSFVSLRVHLLEAIGIQAQLEVSRELTGVGLFVIISKLFHVFADVSAKNVLGMGLSVKVVFLVVVAWESLHRVRDVEATIDGTFKCAEHFVTGGGSCETGVEEASEWTGSFFGWLYVELVTVNFFLADVQLVELHLGQ